MGLDVIKTGPDAAAISSRTVFFSDDRLIQATDGMGCSDGFVPGMPGELGRVRCCKARSPQTFGGVAGSSAGVRTIHFSKSRILSRRTAPQDKVMSG
jgi:hypothetical protein